MVRNVVGQMATGDDCFGRDQEVADLWRYINNGEHILILGPRRTGKSSVMRKIADDPGEKWDAIFLNVEGEASPIGVASAILEELFKHSAYKSNLEKTALGGAIQKQWQALRTSDGPQKGNSQNNIEVIQGLLAGKWQRALDDIKERIESSPKDRSLLLLIDELPIVAARVLNGGTVAEKEDFKRFLGALRALRQNPALQGRLAFVFGGSIGFNSLLERHGVPALMNDVSAYYLGPWDRAIAEDFLNELCTDEEYLLSDEAKAAFLNCFGQFVPSHLQIGFDELRTNHRGQPPTAEEVEQCFQEKILDRASSQLLSHYLNRLEQTFSEASFTAAKEMLRHAAQSPDGVAEADVNVADEIDDEAFFAICDELRRDGYFTKQAGDRLVFESHLLRLFFKNRLRQRTRG